MVSRADHYHVSVLATVAGMHFYEMCMESIRSPSLFVCVAFSGWPKGIAGG